LLKEEYIQKIILWEKNKTISQRSCRKIAMMLNSVLKNTGEVDGNGNQITISFNTVNNILKKYYGRPKKIRKVFFLSKKQIEKRNEFCKMIIEKK